MSKSGKLRIIGGEYRSRIIQFKDAPTLRPTPDRLRETIFNWLSPNISRSKCLDLFAGSGIIGLEAISRGAMHCTFIDINRTTTHVLYKNIQSLKLSEDRYSVQNKRAQQFLQKTESCFDVIFLDPPYDDNLIPSLLHIIKGGSCIHADSIIYIEHSIENDISISEDDWEILKNVRMGGTRTYLIKLKN